MTSQPTNPLTQDFAQVEADITNVQTLIQQEAELLDRMTADQGSFTLFQQDFQALRDIHGRIVTALGGGQQPPPPPPLPTG